MKLNNMKIVRTHFLCRLIDGGKVLFEGRPMEQWSMVFFLKEHGKREEKDSTLAVTKRLFPAGTPKEIIGEMLIREVLNHEPRLWSKFLDLSGCIASCNDDPMLPDEIGDAAMKFIKT